MDKQRDIYRRLILELFKKNFDSSLFVEKRFEMMEDNDFEHVRDEIEDEYFTKNRGIAPYIKAIKYLCTKIEASTADNALFTAVEDYICAKDNIVITKIIREKLQTEIVKPAKCQKRRERKSPANNQSKHSSAHAECNSPQSCKKCRIMFRLSRPNKKGRKPNKKVAKPVSTEKCKDQIKTENSKAEYSDISDSEITTTSSESATNSMQDSGNGVMVNGTKPCMQLPYSDHQYSRISFYGSSIPDNSTKPEQNQMANDKKPVSSEQVQEPVNNVLSTSFITGSGVSVPKTKLKSKANTVIRPKPVIYHFKPNNGLRQITPAYYVPQYIATTPTSTVQSIYKPIPSIFANPTVQTQFTSPVTVLPRPMINHPVYYVSFCEPQQLQRHSNNL